MAVSAIFGSRTAKNSFSVSLIHPADFLIQYQTPLDETHRGIRVASGRRDVYGKVITSPCKSPITVFVAKHSRIVWVVGTSSIFKIISYFERHKKSSCPQVTSIFHFSPRGHMPQLFIKLFFSVDVVRILFFKSCQCLKVPRQTIYLKDITICVTKPNWKIFAFSAIFRFL